MKRIFVFFGAMVLACGVHAQMNRHENYIGFNFGNGMNTLTYTIQDGSWSPKLGFLSELRFTHFYNEQFGFGGGIQYNYAHAGATISNLEVAYGLIYPADGRAYDARTTFQDWQESQTVHFLSIPVEFYWRKMLDERWTLLSGAGLQFDFALSGSYSADEGCYDVQGYFPSTGITYRNHPASGFTVYNADAEGDLSLNTMGLSLITDVGVNYAFDNLWSLYLAFYIGFGITNLNDASSNRPMLSTPDGTDNSFRYNGFFASNQVDGVHRLDVGVKVGVNFGWDGPISLSKLFSKDNNVALTHFDGHDSTRVDSAAHDTTLNHSAVHDTTAAQGDTVALASGNDSVVVDEETEAADLEARCDARRMNNPELKQSLADIDADIADAEKAANETNYEEAQAAVSNAQANAIDAKVAYRAGRFCRAYDLFNEAYVEIATSYAAVTRYYADHCDKSEAQHAYENAEIYAKAARKDGLEGAVAGARNAKIYVEIASAAANSDRGDNAYADPKFANRMANEALEMANQSGSKPAVTDAKDASGKAYRGNLPECYAAVARSFAESAESCASQTGGSESTDALREAQAAAKDATVAARNSNTVEAYRAAVMARAAAQRACSTTIAKATTSAKEPKTKKSNKQKKTPKAKQPTKQPTTEPTTEPTNQPSNQQVQQTTNQVTNQQPSNPPTKQPTTESTNKTVNQPVQQPTSQPAKQPVQQPSKPERKTENIAQKTSDTTSALPKGQTKTPKVEPVDQRSNTIANLQKALDQINATVYFEFSRTKPKLDAKTDSVINALCAAMAADKSIKVLIVGHTDDLGPAASNIIYGKRRAEALKLLMAKRGAPATSITTSSRGEEEPAVENDTDEHRYLNRRAVIILQ